MAVDVTTEITIDRPRAEVTAFVAQFLGRRLRYTYEVTQLIPGERLVMSTAEGQTP